jgi:hypothetical protein
VAIIPTILERNGTLIRKIRTIAVALVAAMFLSVSGHAWAQPTPIPKFQTPVASEATDNLGQELEVPPRPWADFWFRCTPLPYENRQVFVYTEFDNSIVDRWANYTVRLKLKKTINSKVVVQERVFELGPGDYRNDIAAFVLQEPVYRSPADGKTYRWVKAITIPQGGDRKSMPWVKAAAFYKDFVCPAYTPTGPEG